MTDKEQRERTRLHRLWATGRATMHQMDRCRELDNKAQAEELARNEMGDTERLECFSWNTKEGHLFRVRREGDAWVFHETLARFPARDVRPALLGAAIHALKRWSWVKPADVKEEVAHANDAR